MTYTRPKKKALGVVLLFVVGASVYTGTFMYLGLIQPLDGIAEQYQPSDAFFKSSSNDISVSLRGEKPVIKHLLNLESSDSLDNQIKYQRSTLLGTIIRSVLPQEDKLSLNYHQLNSWTKERRAEDKRQYGTLANNFLEGSAPANVSQMHGLRDLKGDPKDDGYFPMDTACPFMGLRKAPYLNVNGPKPESNKHCVGRQPTEEECERAARLYESGGMPLSCQEEPEKELCKIVETWRPAPDSKIRVRCQLWPCGTNPVYVASINPTNGVLDDEENWSTFNTTQSLQKELPEIIRRDSRNGFQFCFLHCLRRDGKKTIRNILTFPPLFTNPMKKTKAELFNINVLVLDSVSRRHFYRSLSETVATLRELFYDNSAKAAILDFEFLQSLAPHTFPNIRAFMSGQDNFHYKGHAQQEYGIGTLFGQMKRLGYYTLLQTDECWFDMWGSILTNNILKHGKNQQDLYNLWEQIKKGAKMNFVDDYGMLFSSCEVFKQYNVSSQYDKNTRKICFNGRVFPQYFFDYTTTVLKASTAVSGKMPTFSFTHLNIGHEPTGTRIQQVDRSLAEFLRKMAVEEDTLTVVVSDHGPKTTPYSFSSVEGRYEIYDPFLFMVVPDKVAEKLGPDIMHALATNRHRLLSLAELHNAFMSIGNARKSAKTRSFREIGVFAEIPEERSCADIQVQQGALCKCQGRETWFPDNDPRFSWVAEFALGQLNNLIQQEYIQTRELGSGGFGKCQRLVGSQFVNIHRAQEGDDFLLSMDIIVRPLKQVFEIQVKYPIDLLGIQDQRKSKKIALQVELTYRRRVSTFRRFSECVDDGVEVRLCVCDYMSLNEHHNNEKPDRNPRLWRWNGMNSQTDVMEIIRRANSFGGITKTENLHENCLLLLIRSHSEHRSCVYEVANSCSDRSYVVHVLQRNDTRPVEALRSSALPFSISVLQRTMHFLFSVYIIDERSSEFSPVIKFNTIKLRS